MDAWLIVLITFVSGITLFSICFSIKLRKNRRRSAARNATYSTQIVMQPAQTSNFQDQSQQMPYNPQYPQSQNMPYPQSQNMPYPQTQQPPYPTQMPYPQQSNLPIHSQGMSFVPSTNNQPLVNPQYPQQYFSPPQAIIVNPSPSAPPVHRY